MPETPLKPEETTVPDESLNENQAEQDGPKITSEPLSEMAAKPSRRKLFLIGGWGLMLIILLAAGAFYKLHKTDAPLAAAEPATISRTPTVTVAPSTGLLEKPQVIADPRFITDYKYFGEDCPSNISAGADDSKCTASASAADMHYYSLGQTAQGSTIIVLIAPVQAVDSVGKFVFLRDASGHYTLNARASGFVIPTGTNQDQSERDRFLKAVDTTKVGFDTSAIPELAFPATASFGDVTLKLSSPDSSGFFTDGLDKLNQSTDFLSNSATPFALKKIGTTQDRTFYEVTVKSDTNFQLRKVIATVKESYGQNYTINQSFSDSKVAPAIKWNDGGDPNNSATYVQRTPGCGFYGSYVVLTGLDSSTLINAGTGPSGETIYQLPTNNAFFQEIYTTDYNKGESIYQHDELKNLSAADFQKQHAVFVVKDGLGDYTAYLRSDFFQGGGCGKPVIYLYPTHDTSVSVKVGAHVTVSSPTYPSATGWQNVLARPNGQLTYRGKQYDSLFWEGLGFGNYPAITSGTIVTRNQVVSTIRVQLKAQGFNAKETNDFLDFWQSRLPRTAYTRLTWLDTQQMNQLAPLQISPRPQTMIRTFLDFQGLDTPVSMTPQTFTAPARSGFTVTEWGGLLRGQQ